MFGEPIICNNSYCDVRGTFLGTIEYLENEDLNRQKVTLNKHFMRAIHD